MWLELLLFISFLMAYWIISDHFDRERITKHMQVIPCVTKLPILGGLLIMRTFHPKNLHLKFHEFVLRYGKTFYSRCFGMLYVVTADVRYIEELLHSSKHTHKNSIYQLLSQWLGDGLILSHGKHWQTMRKIVTPTFHFKILEQFVEVFDRHSMIFVQQLEKFADGETVVNIFSYMKLAAIDSVSEAAMGVCPNAQLNAESKFVEAVDEAANIVVTRLIRPQLAFPFFFRIFDPALYKKNQEVIATVHDYTHEIITKRREILKNSDSTNKQAELGDGFDSKKHSGLLDVLLQSSIEGKPLTDVQIRDEVNTFLFAGHDTTTTAISMSLYLLSRNADTQQKLLEEIYAHFGQNREQSFRMEDLQNLTYLNAVVKESLRMYPPLPAIGRLLEEDCVLADATLPAGTNIIILIWELVHDPVVFPEPFKFKPERHLESNPFAHIYSNIVFSAGPRNCVGQRFALLQIKVFIIKMLLHYELLPLGPEVEPFLTLILKSSTGINIGLKPRVY